MDILAKRLKELRKRNKVTQKQLAVAIEISERNYQDYEYGKVIPTALILVSLADYFNVSLDYLTGRTDEPVNPNVKNNNS